MRKALMLLVATAAIGAVVYATPAPAMGTDATDEQEQAQLHPNQPPEAAAYGVPEGKVYYAQALSASWNVQAPSAGPPSPGAIEPPSGEFMQTPGAVIEAPVKALVTPYVELLGQPAL
jgi:hypothetical protein